MSHHWNLKKKEIEKWLDRKMHEFVAEENKNSRLTKEQWLDIYFYTKIHEIFLCTILIKLYEWIAKLAYDQGRWKLEGSIVWTPELVWRLEASEDKIAHDVDNWLDRVKGGFVTEFAVDTTASYSEVERSFLKGL